MYGSQGWLLGATKFVLVCVSSCFAASNSLLIVKKWFELSRLEQAQNTLEIYHRWLIQLLLWLNIPVPYTKQSFLRLKFVLLDMELFLCWSAGPFSVPNRWTDGRSEPKLHEVADKSLLTFPTPFSTCWSTTINHGLTWKPSWTIISYHDRTLSTIISHQ